ncbi:hypothetical protein ISS85_01245 [Candidatus Microgenomates bacterium]|nr:hypothetical protein [Candidatus Microgenomates bacterium]
MMEKKSSYIIIGLLIVASFLLGSIWTKTKSTEKPSNQANEQQGQDSEQEGQAFAPAKKKTPEVKFFVMSFCPFGNQAETGLKPVADLLGDQVDWQPVYIASDAKQSCENRCAGSVYDEDRCQQLVDGGQIPDMDTCKGYFPYDDADTCLEEKCESLKAGEFTSLHGEQELNQDVREICAWNLGDEEKWWDFVEKVNDNCSDKDADTCWEKHAKDAGLDTNKIKDCEKNQAADLLKKDMTLSEEMQAFSSPMVFVNDEIFNGGRAPEDYKQAICSGFEKAPKECDTVLGDTTEAPAGGCE